MCELGFVMFDLGKTDDTISCLSSSLKFVAFVYKSNTLFFVHGH